MMATLGFRSGALTDGWSQTANGKVKVKMGTLRSVKVGDAEAKNLRVTFIADDRVGKTKLLGMNFLKSFRFSIDDKKNQLILLLQ
jgi:aspartyl protease family protein